MTPLNNINRIRMMNPKRVEPFIHRHAKRMCRIWSDQWGAYWRENKCGYTNDKGKAGVYSFEEAFKATSHCGPEKKIYYEFLTPLN